MVDMEKMFLLGYFRVFSPSLPLSILHRTNQKKKETIFTAGFPTTRQYRRQQHIHTM